MTIVGRNDPCPCGSGKKYKKCCLAKDESGASTGWRWPWSRPRSEPEPRPPAPQRRPASPRGTDAKTRPRDEPTPPSRGREHAPASTQATLKSLDETLHAGSRVLLSSEYYLTHGALRSMGYSPEHILRSRREASLLLLRYLLMGGTSLSPHQTAARVAVRAQLRAKDRRLYDALLAAPFGVYRIVAGGELDALEVEATFGDGAPTRIDASLQTAAHAVRFEGGRAEGAVGWLFEHGGRRYFLALGQLGVDGTKLLETLAADWPATDRYTSAEVISDVLSALVDPTFELRRAARDVRVSHRPGAVRSAKPTIEGAAREAVTDVVWQIHDSGSEPIAAPGRIGTLRLVRRFRERVASAESAEERAALIDFVRRLRDDRISAAIRRVVWNRHVDSTLCERLVPLARIAGAFGLRPDGTFEGLDESDLTGRPSALLLLPDDHPVWASVNPAAPIGAARRWAAERPATEASAAIEAAWHRYLCEERWLATFRPAEGSDFGLVMQPRYGELIRVFATLFDPAVRETPLDELDLGRGGLTRLVKAMGLTGLSPADGRHRVRDLPDDESSLMDGKGYGLTTHERLVDALALLASQWRPRRAGIDPATLDRAPRGEAVQEILREGLDELASLFDPE